MRPSTAAVAPAGQEGAEEAVVQKVSESSAVRRASEKTRARVSVLDVETIFDAEKGMRIETSSPLVRRAKETNLALDRRHLDRRASDRLHRALVRRVVSDLPAGKAE